MKRMTLAIARVLARQHGHEVIAATELAALREGRQEVERCNDALVSENAVLRARVQWASDMRSARRGNRAQ